MWFEVPLSDAVLNILDCVKISYVGTLEDGIEVGVTIYMP